MNDGDAETLAAIRARVEAEPTWRGVLAEDLHSRADRRWLLARVGQLEAELDRLRDRNRQLENDLEWERGCPH